MTPTRYDFAVPAMPFSDYFRVAHARKGGIVYLVAMVMKFRESGQVRLCIDHLVRHFLRYVIWKERKQVAADLRATYGAATPNEAD